MSNPETHIQIIQTVARFYKVDAADMLAAGKGVDSVSFARQVAMTICLEHARPTSVCVLFNKSSGSATHAKKNIADICSVDKRIAQDVTEVRGLVMKAITTSD